MYFLSCNGSGVEQFEVAQLQCLAISPTCQPPEAPVIPIESVVQAYVNSLNMAISPTTSVRDFSLFT